MMAGVSRMMTAAAVGSVGRPGRIGLLARLGRAAEAADAYAEAIGLTQNEAERDFLRSKTDA